MKYNRRMQESDISHVIIELNSNWINGTYGQLLTWSALEDQFGFSRQTLQSKPAIKAAYHHAKKSLSGKLKASKADTTLLTLRIAELEARIKIHETREELWRKRWQQIAYSLRLNGDSLSKHDKKPNIQLHFSKTVAEKIIAPLDRPIPPSGRV